MFMAICKTNDVPTNPESRVSFLIHRPPSPWNRLIHPVQNLDRFKFIAVDEILLSIQRLRQNIH